jgi:SCP-2 sterol transfer family
MATVPETAAELFNDLLPVGLQAWPDRAREINAIFSFVVEGEGSWTLDCTCTPPTVKSGIHSPAITIETDKDSFKQVLSDYNAGIDLYFKNKIRVTGDTNLGLKLALFFDITRKP